MFSAIFVVPCSYLIHYIEMNVYFFIFSMCLLYFALYFTDTMLKSCLHLPYLNLLETSGITIKPLQIKWYTRAMNRSFQRWGSAPGRLTRLWFTLGVWVTCALLLPSVALLLWTVYTLVAPPAAGGGTTMRGFALEPVLPGVNLPADDVPYYLMTLLTCSVLHEIGHAVAAVREHVRVFGSGLLLVLVLPAAYVDVCQESLTSLRPARRLRVLCAGVWHNVVLCALAALLLAGAPFALSPLYHVDDGAVVHHVVENSPLHGATGVSAGDVITAVDDCAVSSRRDWVSCLAAAAAAPPTGFCVTTDDVATLDETIMHPYQRADGQVECCAAANASSHFCFEFIEDVERPERGMVPYSCLPVRAVIAAAPARCATTADCGETSRCLQPTLDNATRLLTLRRRGARDVLFVGAPGAAHAAAAVTSYRAKFAALPATLPLRLETFCRYVLTFSAALAVLNVVPCYALDGNWIWAALVEAAGVGRRRRASVVAVGTAAGTLLLAANVLLGLRGVLL